MRPLDVDQLDAEQKTQVPVNHVMLLWAQEVCNANIHMNTHTAWANVCIYRVCLCTSTNKCIRCLLVFAAYTIYLSKSCFDSTFGFLSTSQQLLRATHCGPSWDLTTVAHCTCNTNIFQGIVVQIYWLWNVAAIVSHATVTVSVGYSSSTLQLCFYTCCFTSVIV